MPSKCPICDSVPVSGVARQKWDLSNGKKLVRRVKFAGTCKCGGDFYFTTLNRVSCTLCGAEKRKLRGLFLFISRQETHPTGIQCSWCNRIWPEKFVKHYWPIRILKRRVFRTSMFYLYELPLGVRHVGFVLNLKFVAFTLGVPDGYFK